VVSRVNGQHARLKCLLRHTKKLAEAIETNGQEDLSKVVGHLD